MASNTDGDNGTSGAAAAQNAATAEATLADALAAATRALAAAGRETPRLDAEVLLRHRLGLDRAGLFARLRDPLGAADLAAYRVLIDARLGGEPVAYLSGEREFMGLAFRVGPGVLVPRPETELLVEWGLERLCDRRGARPAEHSDTLVLDVGTGSGPIALALAAYLPSAWRGQIVGADVSAEALRFARENRRRLDDQARVRLVRGDLAGWCAGGVDLLLANLPYLRPDQVATNPDLAAEPDLALAGGPDGLALVRRLVDDLPRLLAPDGAAGFEVDPSQAGAVARLVTVALPDAAVAVIQDLAGLDRHVVATRVPPIRPEQR